MLGSWYKSVNFGAISGLVCLGRTHLQTLIIYKLGFNQNYYTFTLMLLIKIVLCSKFR